MKHFGKSSLALCLVAVPFMTFASHHMAHYASKNSGKWEIKINYPVFSGSRLASAANREVNKQVAAARGFAGSARQSQKESGGVTNEPYSYDSDGAVSMDRSDLIVMHFSVDQYLGGAHGSQSFDPINIGMVNGTPKHLRLQDLFRSGVNGRATISRIVMEKLKTVEGADWIKDGSVKEINAQNAEQFVITPRGLHFVFNPYEMGPYSSGMIEADVSFDELSGKLNPSGPLRQLLNHS